MGRRALGNNPRDIDARTIGKFLAVGRESAFHTVDAAAVWRWVSQAAAMRLANSIRAAALCAGACRRWEYGTSGESKRGGPRRWCSDSWTGAEPQSAFACREIDKP